MTAVFVDPGCTTCRGRGWVAVDDGDDGKAGCPGCRLTARRIYADRIRAAAEDRVEGLYRDAGFDAMSPLEQWHADGAR